MRVCVLLLCLLAGMAVLAEGFASQGYSPKPIEAKVPAYVVRPNLSNIVNAKILPKLSTEQRSRLVSNGFVARPTAEEQLFYVYENNAYKKIGSFATTDSVLHTYHIFYDFTLRHLEKTRLRPAAIELSRRMLQYNLAALREPAHPAAIHDALIRNAVFFAVPLTLLGEKPALPAEVQKLTVVELARINAHAGRDTAITGQQIDYTQFIPRGHYTRSKEFEQYFKAMMWYGLVPMDLEKDEKLDKPATLQALIITDQLTGDAKALALWQQLYDPTVFYVGKADDLSYYQYGLLAKRIFGAGSIDRFNDDAKLQAFFTAAMREMPGPGIGVGIRGADLVVRAQGKQFRFMGQRFIPDSRILQEVSFPQVGTEQDPRAFPLGLDVFAVLGSPRAAYLLDNMYQQTRYANYLSQRQKMQQEFAALTPKDWQQNLYFGWMYSLLPLLPPRPEGYPSFMRNTAWQEKSLVTALGSWTELRHDTILYAKQSGAECGEGGTPPPPVHGYVEPEVGVYERLSWLLKLNKAGLLQRNLMKKDDELSYSFDSFIELADFLATASRKELRNQPLSTAELRALEHYGADLESLMLSVATLGGIGGTTTWWDIQSKTDRSMALVADVHTFADTVLEEAVGNAAEIWVVVPINGKLYLTRGATFTYYEFENPASTRMTDETWQNNLRKGAVPPMPKWTTDFLLPPGVNQPVPAYQFDRGESGC